MSYGPNYEYYTQPDRADPSTTIHLEDEGMSDGDALWDWIEQYAADDTEIIIPSGTYSVGFGYRRITADNCIVRGEEPTGSVVAEVPGGYSESRYQPVIRTYDRFELSNITISGVLADDSRSGKLKTEALGENSYIYVERYRNPDGGANGSGGIFVGGDSRGETMFKACEINHAHDNGIYGSDPGESYGYGGPVYVEHGRFFNNNISGVRLGSDDSYVWRACTGNTEETQYSDTASGSPTNQRSIRFRSGEPNSNLRAIECDIINRDLSAPNKAIEIYSGAPSNFSGEIRRCRIVNDDESDALRAGGQAFTAYDCHVTGDGNLNFEIAEENTCRGSGCDVASCDHEEPPSDGGGGGDRPDSWTTEESLYDTTAYLQDGAMSPLDDYLAYVGGDGLWLHSTGGDWPVEAAFHPVYPGGNARTLRAAAFSHDGWLAVGGDDSNVHVYEVADLVANGADAEAKYLMGDLAGSVWMVAIDPENDYIASWRDYDDDERVRIHRWTPENTDNIGQVTTLPPGVSSVRGGAFSPDGSRFAFGDGSGTIHVYSIDRASDSFTREGSIDASDSRVWDVTFSHDGKHILSGHADETAYVHTRVGSGEYDLATTLDKATDKVRGVAWADDGKYLAYTSAAGPTHVYTVGDWDYATVVREGSTAAVSCAFSHDLKWLGVTTLEDGYHAYQVEEPPEQPTGKPNAISTVDGVWQTGSDAVLQTAGTQETDAQLAVETLAPQNVTDNTATLRGEVTALENVDPADVYFMLERMEDGYDPQELKHQTVDSPGKFSQFTEGRAADTTYEYWAVAESNDLSATGDRVSFTTEATTQVIDDFEHNDLAGAGWNGPDIGTAFRTQSSTTIGRSGSYSLHLPAGQDGTNQLTSAPGDGLDNYPSPGAVVEFWFMFDDVGGTRHRVQLYYGHDSSALGNDAPDNCYGLWLRGNREPGTIRLYKREGGAFVGDLFDIDVADPHFQSGEEYRCILVPGGTSTTPTHEVRVLHNDTIIGEGVIDDTGPDGSALTISNPTGMEGAVYLDDFRLK